MKYIVMICSLLVVLAACGSDRSAENAAATSDEMTTTDPPATAPASSTTATSETATTSAAPTTTAAPATSALHDEASEYVWEQEPVASDLVGRWAHYDVVAYEDGTLKTLIISYGFNDFEEVDGEIIDSTEFCFSEQRTDQPIETSLSDAATQAIKPPSTPITVESAEGSLAIRREATPTPVGIRLDDPATESLPTDPLDPRIVDDDGDGNPGITVTIDVAEGITGELYIARREIFAYEARLITPDLIEGRVIDESEQLVIGASNPMFNQSANWEQVPDPELSPIILKRVSAEWDCARLATERDDLFPPTPEVDW